MRKRDGWFLIVCIAVLIALIFLAPRYGWELRAFLNPGTSQMQGNGTADLTAENEVLKAQLAELQSVAAELPGTSSDYLPAIVYSRYPMNFKNEMLVNAGANDGVVPGKAVVFQGIFIGTVEKVFPDSALVQTVFDGGFKMPVRVGAKGYDGLFTGGTLPKIASLAKTAGIVPGDIVYTAAPGIPYALPVAVVEGTSTSADALFEEAALGFAYDPNAIQAVLIAK